MLRDAMVAMNIAESSRAKDSTQDGCDQICHDLFRAALRPVAPIQNLISKKLKRAAFLLPGARSVAHCQACFHPVFVDLCLTWAVEDARALVKADLGGMLSLWAAMLRASTLQER